MIDLQGKTVMAMKRVQDKDRIWHSEDDFEGRFIAFGITGEYGEKGSSCYSSVIVIDKESKLHNVPVELIKFTCEGMSSLNLF
jgi:hypothetical protein